MGSIVRPVSAPRKSPRKRGNYAKPNDLWVRLTGVHAPGAAAEAGARVQDQHRKRKLFRNCFTLTPTFFQSATTITSPLLHRAYQLSTTETSGARKVLPTLSWTGQQTIHTNCFVAPLDA